MTTLVDIPLGTRPAGRTLLTAAWVLGHKGDEHYLIANGEVVIDGAQIVYVGQKFPGDVARRLDLGQALISPGLIDLDALSDLDTTILAIDHGPGWAKGRVWPRTYVDSGPYEMYSPEELAFQKRFAFGQLLQNGITTAAPIASLFYREWGETVTEFTAAADAATHLGLRVFLSPAYRSGGMVVDAPGHLLAEFDEARGLQGLADAIAFIEKHHGTGEGLINGMLAPDRVETCTETLLCRTDAAARDLGCKIRLHMAQGEMEVQTVKRLHGKTAPEWLASMGVLSDRIIAPHATNATETDLDLYATHGVSVVHCPLVSARFGSILRSFPRLLARGITIAMGTDTTTPDMLMNLMVGLLTARIAEADAATVHSADLWNAATLGGAKALGRPDLGRLVAGAPADIAIFALDDVAMTPAIDPIATLINGGSGKVTRAVFVDGRLSMRDGAVAGIDMQTARAQAQAQFDGLVQKYPERTFDHPSVDQIFPASYPMLKETP